MEDKLVRRRPIRARSSSWARQVAASLASLGATPNQISLASVGFAALGAGAILLGAFTASLPPALCFLLAGLLIEGRLLCNLFDGMVAVEGGKSTPAGELFNDAPDRFADAILLIAAGYAAGGLLGQTLGWSAALFAVMTAYVRTLGTGLGLAPDFSGPMAKPHRMHTLVAACVGAAILPAVSDITAEEVLTLTLAVIAVLSALTVARRLLRAYRALMSR